MNARTVNNLHLAFILGYLGVTGSVASAIAAWPAQMGARASATNGIIETTLATHPLLIGLDFRAPCLCCTS